MIDFIGGLFGMAVGYFMVVVAIGSLVALVVDHGRSYIIGSYNEDWIWKRIETLIREIPEPVFWVLLTCSLVTAMVVLIFGGLDTGFGSRPGVKDMEWAEYILFPYYTGAIISWIIIPIGIWASTLLGGKAIYQVTQKVSKLKKDIQEHINNGGH